MAVRLGNIEPVNFMLGSKQVEELRLGEQLVWKRKLIEGWDYERYDWLKGVGTCKISTNIISKMGDDIRGKILIDRAEIVQRYKNENLPPNMAILRNTASFSDFTPKIYLQYGGSTFKNTENTHQFLVGITINNSTGPWNIFASETAGIITKGIEITEMGFVIGKEIETSFCTTQLNGKNVSLKHSYRNYSNTKTISNNEYYLFNGAIYDSCLSIGYAKINDHIFTPCQLLRDIPASLDSQGVARSAGTCGMTEEITGIFYTNANTTGAFTVFNN